MTFISFIEEYWTMIVTLGSFIWGYSNLQSRVKENTKDIESLEIKINEISPVLLDIRERLARIETSLSIHFKEK